MRNELVFNKMSPLRKQSAHLRHSNEMVATEEFHQQSHQFQHAFLLHGFCCFNDSVIGRGVTDSEKLFYCRWDLAY